MEPLTLYRFKHSESFSDNYKIAFEKKGRLPQIVVAKLQTKASGGLVWTCPFRLSQTFALANAQKKTVEKARAFIESEKETIFAKFEAAEKEILSLKKPGAVCADFIEFVKSGLN